jgi:hypothetical protein
LREKLNHEDPKDPKEFAAIDDTDCLRSGSSAWAQRFEAAHAEEAMAYAFGGGWLRKTSITRKGFLFEVFEVFVVQPFSPG